jgi:malate dehydrogenase (oxaloacetate-decarboxylating)
MTSVSIAGNLIALRILTNQAECNNSVTFPGIGLGAVLSRTRLMTPALLVAAVQALAAEAPVLKGSGAGLLPDVEDVREISVKIARNVIKKAVEDGLAQEKDIPDNDEELEEWIREQMWTAEYRPLELVDKSSANAHARGEAGVASGQREAKLSARG